MKTIAEVQLRKLAIVLTVLALLLVLWSGVRLLLIAEPESIAPAEASMRIDGIGFGAGQVEEAPSDLSSRPLFWQGREAYTPSVVNNEPGLEVLEGSQRNPAIAAKILMRITIDSLHQDWANPCHTALARHAN